MADAFLKTMEEIRIIVFAVRDLLGLTAKVPKTQYLTLKTPSESQKLVLVFEIKRGS